MDSGTINDEVIMHKSEKYGKNIRFRSEQSLRRECLEWQTRLRRADPEERKRMKQELVNELIRVSSLMAEVKGWTIDRVAEIILRMRRYPPEFEAAFKVSLEQWKKDHPQ